MLNLICPFATEMSRLVGEIVGNYCEEQGTPQAVVELGANLAALVAAEAQSNSAVGAARVQADTDQAAKDMARRGIQ